MRLEQNRIEYNRIAYEKPDPPRQDSKNPHAKLAAKPPKFGALFLSFGGVAIVFPYFLRFSHAGH